MAELSALKQGQRNLVGIECRQHGSTPYRNPRNDREIVGQSVQHRIARQRQLPLGDCVAQIGQCQRKQHPDNKTENSGQNDGFLIP